MSRPQIKITRADCDCKGVVKGTRPKYCPHHNHLVCVPESAKEWDYTKNLSTPNNTAPTSAKKAWWICSKCSMSYNQNITIRTSYGAGCPYCAGKKASPEDNLKTNYPELVKQWDYEKNDRGPENYRPGSNKKVWWICNAEKHQSLPGKLFSWEARIADRSRPGKGSGCPSCNMTGYDQIVGGTQEYIKQCSLIHGNKYIYDRTIYTTADEKVSIICPVIDNKGLQHGEFIKPASSHKAGSGCPKCGDSSYLQRVGGQEYFISEAKRIHGADRYDYDLVKYVDTHTPLEIRCNVLGKDGTIHGIFMQNANNHKNGKGCPKCADEQKMSRKAREIYDYLMLLGYTNDGISMKLEWSDPENLRDVLPLKVDYYLIDCKLLIEVDGSQHFKETRSGTFTNSFAQPLFERLRKDTLKDAYSMRSGKSMLRIPYDQSPEVSMSWVRHAINICKSGNRVYFTYIHFYDAINGLNLISPTVYVALVPFPNLVFVDN
jgi:hypothetical protein